MHSIDFVKFLFGELHETSLAPETPAVFTLVAGVGVFHDINTFGLHTVVH